MMRLIEFIQFPFKFFYAQFFTALFIKSLCDKARFGYFAADIRLRAAFLDEIHRERANFSGEKKPVLNDKIQKASNIRIENMIRDVLRSSLVFTISNQASGYFGTYPNKTRIKAEFLIEEYAFEIFPPFKMVEDLGDNRPNNGCECSNDGCDDFIRHIRALLKID